ncbi:helix-turn-helix transcriptional regulator [Paenibacillus xylanexedens]|uniref:helix-turn-helix transcriptional regulator n=1 Tax=Paenibacillus xylanexedens TaxID=528191 RepID=UPI001C8D7948|nr:helix-turn-helix transcriptional regulator [Paenibacillus xylanexedens]MBY0117901.1 helix-turn-helix transcriptional regulator [Paenibacillus xylanexedens]
MKQLIAKRLMELRGDTSREETSHAIGISVSALQMYENAQRIPKDEIKIRIANYYRKTVQEIFFDFEPHETCSFKKGAS